jgi:hypothetical protein
MIDSDYRKQLYRLIFALAALYNISFGLWTCLWPRAFFDLLEMTPLNYPSLWKCLGMVLGLYGLLYGYAAWRLDRAGPIIVIGLAGKVLGPIGWVLTTRSGEWPVRTVTLVVFNDFIWWLPFALFLLEGTFLARRIRRSAPFACAILNLFSGLALAFALRGGTEAVASGVERAAYIDEHIAVWRLGWGCWMLAAVSLVAFYAWWGASLHCGHSAVVAVIIAMLGLACDLFAESLYIGWLPRHLDSIAPFASLLTGGAANGLYTFAGILLTLWTPTLGNGLRVWAWTLWISGLTLTLTTMLGSVTGMMLSTGVLMTLLCPWVALFGWRQLKEDGIISVAA